MRHRPRSWPPLELALRGVVLVTVFAHPHAFYTYDPEQFWQRTQDLSLHHLPYRDFLWEFPPLTIVALLPAPLVSRGAYVALFLVLMVAAEYGSLLVLRWSRPADAFGITAYWTLVGLPLAAFTWFRLDFISVLFATLALVAVVHHREPSVPLTAGVAAKLWPGVAVAGLVLQRRWRAVIASVAAVTALVLAWFAFSPSGFREFVRYRHGSGFQVESTIGALRMLGRAPVGSASDSFVTDAGRYRYADTAFLLAWAALAVVTVVIALRRPVHLAPLLGALVTWLMVLSRILSPQYLVWLLPFAALAWVDGDRVATIAFGAASVMTLAVIEHYNAYIAGNRAVVLTVVLRNLLLVLVGVRFFQLAFGARPRAVDKHPAR
ncbi:MAG TPA: glycosyltransferase family 87 protein [Acidimicrobiales bacterium]|jgi:hypothetical protein|nr:glycosyltransferase family 87 protein [Acidimicrobiales bacterium]